MRAPAHTRHADERRGGGKDDVPVGQVAAVVVVDVGAHVGRDLAQAGAVDPQFVDLPGLGGIGFRAQQPVGVEVEFEVYDALYAWSRLQVAKG